MSGEPTCAACGRPPVDVVIPFAGAVGDLADLLERASRVDLGENGGAVLIADNRPASAEPVAPPPGSSVTVVRACGERSSYHARNAAARAGRAPWILFLDADVEWDGALLDAYFDPEPGERTAVVGGGLADAPLPAGRRPTPAERYAVVNATMAAGKTLATNERPRYAQTANCLVRRAAFEALGGFEEGIRSAGDADLCWRLQAAGWQLETRRAASAVHRNRRTLIALLGQKARHGAGAAWLERRHPGTFPARRWPGLARWSVLRIAGREGPDAGPRPDRVAAAVDVAAVWAFELGRWFPNTPPRDRLPRDWPPARARTGARR